MAHIPDATPAVIMAATKRHLMAELGRQETVEELDAVRLNDAATEIVRAYLLGHYPDWKLVGTRVSRDEETDPYRVHLELQRRPVSDYIVVTIEEVPA